MSCCHPVVLTILKGIDKAIVLPERLYQRVFPVTDKDGQLVASIVFSRNERSIIVSMELLDSLERKSVSISDDTQCDYEMALRDTITVLALFLGLDVDEIKFLIPLERT